MATAIPKDLVEKLVGRGAGDTNHVRNMLKTLAELAADELAAGNDFTVPGVAKLQYSYRAPQAKGSRWGKGDTVVGFGGIEQVKDSDSPAVKARITLKASATGDCRKFKPGTKPEVQKAFLTSKAGKDVVKRKG